MFQKISFKLPLYSIYTHTLTHSLIYNLFNELHLILITNIIIILLYCINNNNKNQHQEKQQQQNEKEKQHENLPQLFKTL